MSKNKTLHKTPLWAPDFQSTLPNDIEVLKDMVCEYAAVIERQALTISKQATTIANQSKIIADQMVAIKALTDRVQRLEEKYLKLARLHFGQSSEKLSTVKTTTPEIPSDPLLLGEGSSEEEQNNTKGTDSNNNSKETDLKKKEKEAKEKEAKARENNREKHKGRNKLPLHLTRKTIEYDIPAEEKICKECHSFLSFIGFEEREQLESGFERYSVLLYKRKKYGCKNKNCCHGTIITAPTPTEVIEKGLAGPNLLAEVIVDKYCDHLPLYRLQQRFKRQGISINRSTLWHWIYRSALLLEPLVEAMVAHQVVSDHMFADETTIPTLWAHVPENKGKQAKTNYFWVYTSLREDKKDKPIVVYRFVEGRGSQYPAEFLKNFRGYLQADAYCGYNPLFNPTWDEIEEAYVRWCIEVACWGHARRYFVDVYKGNPKSVAKEVLALIGDLYRLEAEFKEKDLNFDEIKEKRQELSKSKLEEIHTWLLTYQPLAPPKSAFGKAIAYSLNNWEALCVYLWDGRLEIDNTRSERNMKGVAVGRKNYLFVASNRGGVTAAILYSIVETCRQNGIDPKAYIADVLQRISTHPNSRINELLPYHWKPPTNNNTNEVVLMDGQKVA